MIFAFGLWVLGIASVVYFGVYAVIIGLNNSFTYFWLFFGLLLAAAGTVLELCHHGRLHLPRAVPVVEAMTAMTILDYLMLENIKIED